MNILAIADEESPYFWDYFEKSKLENVDLILSCGDLNPKYLSFLATFAHCPVLYVHGNHDGRYKETPPEGCICIEDQIYNYKGVRILGLGGSMLYSHGPHQYTERQMNRRIRRLGFSLHRNKGFDILLTHAPAYDLTDQLDHPHRGFTGFVKLMDKYEPQYMVHGHVHLSYGYKVKRVTLYKNTYIINAFEKFEFHI